MKEGRPLPDLAQELCRQADVKRDYLTPAGSLQLHSNGRSYLRIGEDYAINDVAHSQIAEYAGVPKMFYDRLRAASEELTVPVYTGEEEPSYQEKPVFDVLVGKLMEAESRELFISLFDGTFAPGHRIKQCPGPGDCPQLRQASTDCVHLGERAHSWLEGAVLDRRARVSSAAGL